VPGHFMMKTGRSALAEVVDHQRKMPSCERSQRIVWSRLRLSPVSVGATAQNQEGESYAQEARFPRLHGADQLADGHELIAATA